MKVTANLRFAGNEPNGVVVTLPDWGMGGTRALIDMSLWEALRLRTELDRLLSL